jgi:hypothetical protein
MHLWAVVDEAALRRPIGGRDVMRAQLEHLIAMTKRPRVALQIIPFGAGGHAAQGGAFTILRFPDPWMADVVYTEQLTGAVYLDKREDVDTYLAAMERLCLAALPPGATADVVTTIANEM